VDIKEEIFGRKNERRYDNYDSSIYELFVRSRGSLWSPN